MGFEIEDGVLTRYTEEKGVTDVVVPEGVASIGNHAFWNCENIASIDIPDSVTSIGNSAFSGCENLTSITIPDSVTSIGESAFYGCTSLANITIPDSVRNIENSAFSNCHSLTSITIPSSVTSIGNDAFSGCHSLTSITIPSSVMSIGSQAFYWCASLASITISDSVTSIGNAAFYETKWIKNIHDTFVIIGKGVLYKYNGNDNTITIPDGVTCIGYNVFSGCASLTSITIPDSVIRIESDAFSGCTSLANIVMTNPEKRLGSDVFGDTYPDGLYKTIPNLPLYYDDYYISENIKFHKLSYETQAKMILTHQSNIMYKIYQKVFKRKDSEKLITAICSVMNENTTEEECNNLIEFLKQFAQIMKKESVAMLYNALCSVPNGKDAEKELNKVLKNIGISTDTGRTVTEEKNDISPVAEKIATFMSENGLTNESLQAKLKENYAISFSDLPTVSLQNGTTAPAELIPLVILNKKAKGFANELDEASFKAALNYILENYLGLMGNTKKKYLAEFFCRYADEEQMSVYYQRADSWKDTKHYYSASIYSDTKLAAVFAAEHDFLNDYAKLRGTDAITYINKHLSDIGLDENGIKQYDLGNFTVSVKLLPDMTFVVESPNAKKPMKSIPQKDADEEKYNAAAKAFDEMKKQAKKIQKLQAKYLMSLFLNGKTIAGSDWREAYLKNPLLRGVVQIIVWQQGQKTFILNGTDAITSDGKPYSIKDKSKIKVAHPIEMKPEDVSAWQNYFIENKLKQPFEQVFEPAFDPASISPDRYKDTDIPALWLFHLEKHGIRAGARNSIFYLDLPDLKIDYDYINNNGYLDKDAKFVFGKLEYEKFTRYVNHIIYIFDKLTVRGRIKKDDTSILLLMDRYNCGQIKSFLDYAIECNAVNVTAELMEYKNNHFPDDDPLSYLSLDW